MADPKVTAVVKLSDLLSDAIKGLQQEEGAVKKKKEPDPEPVVVKEDDEKKGKPEEPKKEPVRPPPEFEQPDWRYRNPMHPDTTVINTDHVQTITITIKGLLDHHQI